MEKLLHRLLYYSYTTIATVQWNLIIYFYAVLEPACYWNFSPSCRWAWGPHAIRIPLVHSFAPLGLWEVGFLSSTHFVSLGSKAMPTSVANDAAVLSLGLQIGPSRPCWAWSGRWRTAKKDGGATWADVSCSARRGEEGGWGLRATTRVLQRRPPPAGAAEARRWRRPEGGAGAWRHPAGCSAQRAATSPRPPGCWSGGCGCPRACVAGARGRRSPRLAVGAPPRRRRRRDLEGTGRSERPSLLPLLAPLSARRGHSGGGAMWVRLRQGRRERARRATPPEGAASWRGVYREGTGKGAERRGAAQNQLGHCGTDLGRKIEIGRLRITVDVASHWGRNRPPSLGLVKIVSRSMQLF